MAVRKPILAAKPQVERKGAIALLFDEVPYPTLVIIFRQITRCPAIDPVCALDLANHHVIAEIRRKEAQPVDLLDKARRVCHGNETAQGDPTQPNRAAPQRPGGKDDLVPQPAQDGSICQALQLQLHEDEINRQAPLTCRANKPFAQKVFRCGVGSR